MKSIVVLACGIACSLALAPGAAAQLSYEEIVRVLPGRWAMETPDGPNGELTFNCERRITRIWFEKDANGALQYRSLEESDGSATEIARSPVLTEQTLLGGLKPLIRIRYEDETYLTDAGKKIEWHLIMLDHDTFYWRATHWRAEGGTYLRRRCPNDDPIS